MNESETRASLWPLSDGLLPASPIVRSMCRILIYTVFDLISEHALISGHPPFFVLKLFIII